MCLQYMIRRWRKGRLSKLPLSTDCEPTGLSEKDKQGQIVPRQIFVKEWHLVIRDTLNQHQNIYRTQQKETQYVSTWLLRTFSLSVILTGVGVGAQSCWILWMRGENTMFLEKTYTVLLWFYMERVSHCFHHHRKQLNKSSSVDTSLRRYRDIRHECDKCGRHKGTSDMSVRSTQYFTTPCTWVSVDKQDPCLR